jgi:hypothetical protein
MKESDKWEWEEGARVSQLSFLLYLNTPGGEDEYEDDEYEDEGLARASGAAVGEGSGGENENENENEKKKLTTRQKKEEEKKKKRRRKKQREDYGGHTVLYTDDSPRPVAVAPRKGDALVFAQSFKLGRPRVRDSQFAMRHEGAPLAPTPTPAPAATTTAATTTTTTAGGKKKKGLLEGLSDRNLVKEEDDEEVDDSSARCKGGSAFHKYVLRSDVLYRLPDKAERGS